jgi:DNA-binding SARP family transcriptional activator/tetratricopeptide (TPR) repeat protein
MHFQVLGPVRAQRGDDVIEVGQPRQQAVLAMLLLAGGRVVSPTELVDGVWGEAAPGRAIGAVRNYIYRLRRAMEPDPASPRMLRSVGSGYLLEATADALDAGRFEQQVSKARYHRDDDDLLACAELLRQALALHTGEPLAGVPGPYAHAQRARLVERRLIVLEDRLDVELRAGLHTTVVAELSGLVAEHPLRERLLELRMLALYRCGQQTSALDAFAEGRRRLVSELGVEPGPALRELQRRILAGDDALNATQEPNRVVVPTQRRPAPNQLPAAVADFTGREEVVEQVTAALRETRDALPVWVISGLGGVGKTAVAVRIAHRLAGHFPDGQLYADLHGLNEQPAYPETVLRSFLRALGVPNATIPDELDERAALLRSVLAGRRMLMVLDNARDAAQVQPLLPGSTGCAVLITSRDKLTSLPGIRRYELTEFTMAEALVLLGRIVGEPAVTEEPQAARAVVRACGRLPLAVRISASRLAARPNWTLGVLAERLADQRERLEELRIGDVAVGSTFRLGYDQLDPDLARAFRLLSVSLPDGFSRYSAGAMLDCSPRAAERLCERLVDLSLLQSAGAGRYRQHDLLRVFAREHTPPTAPADLIAAQSRLVDFHMTVALTTIACGLSVGAVPMSLAEVSYLGLPLADMSAMRTWLTQPAATEPMAGPLYQLALAVELESIAGLVETAAAMLCGEVRQPQPKAGMSMLTQQQHRRLDSALVRLRARHPAGDPRATAQLHALTAIAATLDGRLDEARAAYAAGLVNCADIGDVQGMVIATSGQGRILALSGEFDQAYELCAQARDRARAQGAPHAEAYAAHVFAQVADLRGDAELTSEMRAETIRLWFATKQPVPGETAWLPGGIFDWSRPETGVGAWLGVLGHALADLDRPEQARACWRQAIDRLAGQNLADTVELRALVSASAADSSHQRNEPSNMADMASQLCDQAD